MSNILGLKPIGGTKVVYIPVESINEKEIIAEKEFPNPVRKFVIKEQVSKGVNRISSFLKSLIRKQPSKNYKYVVVFIDGVPNLVRIEAQLEEVFDKLTIPDRVYIGGWSGDTVTIKVNEEDVDLITSSEIKGWKDVEVTIKDGEGHFTDLGTDNFFTNRHF